MGRLQIATVIAVIGAFALALPALAMPRAVHHSESSIVPAKVTCKKWCGRWKTVWATNANGITTKTKKCEFWASSCTDDGR